VTRVRTVVVEERTTAAGTVATLEDDDTEVVVAHSLSEGVRAVHDHQPDVVVTEYRLPDGTGLELLDELQSTYPMLPVVVYTAHGSEQIASECIEAGVSAYIPKGGDAAAERLVDAIEEVALTGRSGGAVDDLPGPSSRNIVRAVDEAPVGITLSDASAPDNPLVYANEGFTELTGYGIEAIRGRNCRFLQGPDTDEQPVARMREAIDDEEPVTVEVRNYRADGTPFWNRVTIAPLYDGGELVHYVGFQEDVTERKEAEARARQRADELATERQALEHVLDRVSGLVNDVSHALVAASNREDIERGVCAEITATDGYSHAWIGERQAAGATMTVRASDGCGQLAAGSSAELSGTVFERALDQGTVIVADADEAVPAPLAPGRFDAAAMAVVPLTYRRVEYGVLCVYAERADVLDRHERAVFDAVGQMVASGLNAVETKQILTANRVTELGFEIADDGFPLVQLARRSGGTVSYDGSTLEEGGSFRLFVTVSDITTDEPLEDLIASCDGVADGFVIARQEGSVAASVELSGGHPFGELAEYGATLRDLSVSPRAAQVHIDLPVEGDTRTVLSALEAVYDGVTLIRQREREREPRLATAFTSAVADRLTDRQYTALETAYLSDYFEFPRPVSGDELAESMGISRQTYHQHLRAAQRKLLDEFFEST